MERTYYIGEGPEVDELISECTALYQKATDAREALRAEAGADTLLESRGRITHLAFKTRQTAPYLKGEIKCDGFFGYKPKLNCKRGKALSAMMCAEAVKCDLNGYILKKFKLTRWCPDSRAMHMATAYCVGKKLLVSIPMGKNGDPMPTIPEWLHLVKESEYLAAQGK